MADERRKLVPGHRLRRHEDPTMSDDPRVVALLDELATVSRATTAALTPRPEFRDELRAQLVAITPRIVAESAAENAPAIRAREESVTAPSGMPVLDRPRPTPRPQRTPRRSLLAALTRVPMGRPLMIAASIVTVLALVLGGAVFMSRDAVPGDTLYGLKRTSEDVRLSFAGSDGDRAEDYLDFAQTRVEEARTLVGRTSASGQGPLADGRLSDATSALITSALASADSDTRNATRLLATEAVNSASPAPLSGLTTWLPQQWQRLAELRAAAPSDQKVAAATSQSLSLLATARTRASALADRVDCNCLRGGPTDAFGPLPVAGTPNTPGTTPGGTASTGTGATSTPSSGGTTRPGTTGGTTTGPGGLPTKLPTELPTELPSQFPTQLPIQLPTELPSIKIPGRQPTRSSDPTPDGCKINVLGIRICSPTGS